MDDMRDHFQVGDLIEVVRDGAFTGKRGRIERFDQDGFAIVPSVSRGPWHWRDSFKLIERPGSIAAAHAVNANGTIVLSTATSGLETDLPRVREERQRIERQLTELRNDLDFANAEWKRERHARILAEDELRREKARRR